LATYYVDATTGDDDDTGLSEALAWQTIAKVNASSFSPDDFILFKCGETWAETLTVPSSGTAGHPITFASYGTGAKPVINASGKDNGIQDKLNQGYITIDGFEVNDATYVGIGHTHYTSGVENSIPGWIIQNCETNGCGIIVFGPDTIVQDNILTGPQNALAAAGGLIVRGLVATDCQVLRNTVSAFNSRGIWFLIGTDTPTVNDNIVHDIAVGTAGYGIDFDGYGRLITGTVTCTGNTVYNVESLWGIYMENCSDGSVIKNNIVYNCDDAGIAYMNYAAGTNYGEQRGNNVGGVVSYNVIYGCNKGIYMQAMGGVDFWNNVVDDPAGATPKGVGVGGSVAAYSSDIDIQNNVFGAGLTYVCTVPGNTWTDVISEFDYNCVEDITIMNERGDSGNHNLAALQAASRALNCFTDDPLFVDADNHDYHLQATSPCINAGVDVGLTEDIEGEGIW